MTVNVWNYSVNIFYLDQWDFLGALYKPVSLWKMFNWQHGPPRLGLGLPLMIAGLRLTHANQNVLAYMSVVVFALNAAAGLWLKFRLTQRWSWHDLLIPTLFLSGSQWANVFSIADLSHGPLEVFLVLAFCLVLTCPRGWARTVGLIVTLFCAIFTGFGIFLAPLGAFYFAIQCWFSPRSELKQNLTGLVGTLLSVILYLHGFVFQTSSDCFVFPDPHPDRYFKFIMYSYARAVGGTQPYSLPTLIGFIICVAVMLQFVYLGLKIVRSVRKFEILDWVTWITTSFALVFAVNAAFGRVCYGSQAGMVSRYVTYTVVGIFALYLRLEASQILNKVVLAFVVLIVAIDLWPNYADLNALRDIKERRSKWANCYINTHSIDTCNVQARYELYPVSLSSQFREKLQFLEDHDLSFFHSGP